MVQKESICQINVAKLVGLLLGLASLALSAAYRTDDRHRNRNWSAVREKYIPGIHLSLKATGHCFCGYVEKQPVAWKECFAQYSLTFDPIYQFYVCTLNDQSCRCAIKQHSFNHSPILCFSNSAATKDMTSKIWTNGDTVI